MSPTRRDLLGAAAAGAGALAAAACAGGDDPGPAAAGGGDPVAGAAATTTPPDPARWLIDENARPGSGDWTIPDDRAAWERIRGFADTTSVGRGGSFQLFVSTEAPEWQVLAYRIGWYGGAGARLVWESETYRGESQDDATMDPTTRMVEAPWRPNAEVTVDDSWPPGTYLLKVRSSDGGQSWVPMCLRDDASTAAIAVQQSVTTWQAYNEWGGNSLYASTTGGAKGRADVVTFDRPYYRNGSGEFFGREFEFVLFLERHGYDVTYWTDLDLHAVPERALGHRAVVTLGHDEYYSTPMRRGLENARDAGVNLVFLGANACFRKIRMEPSDNGELRREVNYRSAQRDPITATDPSEATVSWRQNPVREPESSLIGNYYESNPVDADMVVVNAESWIFEGSGLRNGDVLPGLVANEYDRVTPEAPTPTDIEVVCHSPVVCRGKRSWADVSWYTVPDGAGVFAVGTFEWIKKLAPDTSGATPSAADPPAALQVATRNVLDVVAAGPAGRTRPAVRNLEQFGIRPGYVSDPPPT